MAEVKWIKIVTDIFDDEKIALIETLPDGDSIIVIWFKLLCLAGKQNNCGVFMLNEKIAYTDEMLATIFRRQLNTVRLALNVFEQYGMVEIINGVYTIPNWDKHQSLDAYERKKQMDRERIAKKRAEQKAVAELSQNVADSRIVEEDKKKIENKNKNNIFSEYADGDSDLLSALEDFEKMRKSIKKPLTDRAKQMLCNKLSKFKDTDRIPILEQSISHCWADVYELKEPGKTEKSNSNGTASYDIDRAVREANTSVPTVKKRERR